MRNKTSTERGQISTQRAIDKQSGGNHYKNLKYQVSEFILGNELNWIDANIVKYAVRNKDGESLEQKYNKIIHYAELGKELLKNKK
tara:strand:- start:23 stop:280 length:258 start_codon:yes stop_codon:yes gene_type:complete